MRDKEVVAVAEKFLKDRKIKFLSEEYKIKSIDDNNVEVTFLNLYALDPNYVVDPQDFKVIVNVNTLEAHLITQM